MTHRFFIPADWMTATHVTLQGDIARQIRTVLRMQPDDEIVVLDNSGFSWRVRLTDFDKRSVTGELIRSQLVESEPQTAVTLYQGTLKGQKFEWVLQKCTELGVSRFVPLICARSVVNNKGALAKKHPRWEKVIQEAAEQSGRGKLPRLESAMTFAEVGQHLEANTLAIMLWESAKTLTLRAVFETKPATSIALFIGPEGGFTQAESEQAQQVGAKLVTLGPRILRAETASVAACAITFHQVEDSCADIAD